MTSPVATFAMNPHFDASPSYPAHLKRILNIADTENALREISSWDGYAVTPLVHLPALASRLGIASLDYKDESDRFGLGSFKALGGAYAVLQILLKHVEDQTGEKATTAALLSGTYRHLTRSITVCSATDGNHGRSVAWGAEMFGCKCVIYIHATVSEGRKDSIEKYGATVNRIDGNYDDSVRFAASEAERNGYIVVSDTSYGDYVDIPRDVMRGYTVLASEIVGQFARSAAPTHLFVQCGVGGLAAALCAHFWEAWGDERPALIVVEPENAACFCASVEAGIPTPVTGDLETMMAGLSCGEVSTIAWDILKPGADACLAVPDSEVAPAMRMLARPNDDDLPVRAGESAVGGLVGLIAALGDIDVKTRLKLDQHSRVLCIGSEGATDPDLYEKLVFVA